MTDVFEIKDKLYKEGYEKGKKDCQEKFDISEARGMGWEKPSEIGMGKICGPRSEGFIAGWNDCVNENS